MQPGRDELRGERGATVDWSVARTKRCAGNIGRRAGNSSVIFTSKRSDVLLQKVGDVGPGAGGPLEW